MTTYNPNDFYPRSGQEIKSDGTTVNEADGHDSDGEQFVEGKVIGPTLLTTIPYTSFTASTTFFQTLSQVLNRGAKQRTIAFTSTLNQAVSSGLNLYLFDSAIQGTSGTGFTTSDYSSTTTIPASNGKLYVTSEANGSLAKHCDSLLVGLPMGATAPTSGSVQIWLIEVK